MISYSSLGYSFLSYCSREPFPDWVEEYLRALHIVVNCSLVFQPEGAWVLEQAPQGRGQSIRPDSVQEAFGQRFQAHGDILGGTGGGPVQGHELHLMILMGPFQLSLFCVSSLSTLNVMTSAVQIRTGYETVRWSKKMQSVLTSVTKNPE